MKMRALLQVLLSSSSSHQCNHRISHSSLLHFSSISTSTSTSVPSSPINSPNRVVIDYLINTLGFSKSQVDSVSKYIKSVKVPKMPDSFVHLLREFGFSEIHIRKAVVVSPQVLFADVEKTLKPKISLFQKEFGLTGSDLGRFISANAVLLSVSLERRLIPNISLLKKFIPEIENKENRRRGQFIRRQRCVGFFGTDPKKLLSNISFLQSCGIVESQLSILLKRELSLFSKRESVLRNLIHKAQEMGFSCDSRMLVYAVFLLGNSSSKTLENKFKLLRSFGFSQEECSAMSRSQPGLLLVSDKKLKLGIDFFDGAGFERKMLVRNPTCLMLSLEKRMIPRFRVYQILKSKQQQLLNNKCPSFPSLLMSTEKMFLEKFVFKFKDNAEELLAAYNNGNVLNSSTEQN